VVTIKVVRPVASRVGHFCTFVGWGLANCFRFGQMYLLVSFSMLAAFYFSKRDAPKTSGFVAGLFVTVKYFPIVVATNYVLKKNWRAFFCMVLMCIITLTASVVTLAWEVHRQFFNMVLGSHLQADLSGQNPFSTTYQSFDSLFRQMFVFDSSFNPLPLVASSLVYIGMKALTVTSILALGAYCILKLRHLWSSSDLP